jgi:septal ring factor EnvC (AmiA/AmiB activator)
MTTATSKIRTPRFRAVGTACTAALLTLTLNAAAEDKVNSVISEQVKAEEAARASQQKVTQLDDETTKMLGEYRQMIAETTSLKGYNDQLATQVKSQDEQLKDMTQQLGEIETTSHEVMPMMQRMLATLEQFVKLDIPFLPDERSNRINSLKDMIGRADVSIAEKYRRIVEAYQIEMEYGRTIEAYEGKLNDKTVDFLRAGRVSLMYQTRDGKETGYWNAKERKWVTDDSYSDYMKAGLKVARKQAAPDFLTVSVRAPQEAK